MLNASQILNFVAGGHETVGTAFMWACYALATFSSVQDKLFNEIKEMYTDKAADWVPDFADIEQLNYLNNFVREILRVYSPGERPFRCQMPPQQLTSRFFSSLPPSPSL